jgi:hypothetical protein
MPIFNNKIIENILRNNDEEFLRKKESFKTSNERGLGKEESGQIVHLPS